MKVTSSYVIDFHIWKPSVPGSDPTGWIPLNLNYGGRKCLLLKFLALNPTEEFQLGDILAYFKPN
jgi:hypothetical protein